MSDSPRAAMLRKKMVEAFRQYGANRAEIRELLSGFQADGFKLFDEEPEKSCDSEKVADLFAKTNPLGRGPRCPQCGGGMRIVGEGSKAGYRGCR